MKQLTSNQIVKTIEGVTALCLGSSDRIVWVNQADAAAFSDGEKIYLPKPTGEHSQEYDLLLAIALREVAKFYHSETSDLANVQADIKPYAAAIEEARIKMVLGKTYLGAKSIFDTAVKVVCDIIGTRAEKGSITAEAANQLAVWASSHDGLLNSENSSQAVGTLVDLAALSTDKQKLFDALALAKQAVQTASTFEAIELGSKVLQVLRAEPPEQTPPPPDSQEPQAGPESAPQEDKPESQPTDQQKEDKPDAGPQDDAQSDPDQGNNPDSSPNADGSPPQGEQPQAQPSGESHQDGQPTDGDQTDAAPSGDAATQDGASEKQEGDKGSPSDDSPQQGEHPQDQTSGDRSQKGQPAAGDQTDAASSDGTGGQEGDSQGSDAATDVLSDALAMLKGFAGSVDVASQAGELRKLAVTPEFSPTESELQAIGAALSLAEDAAESLAIAIEGECDGTEPQDSLTALLGGAAGGGYADPESLGSNSLLSGVQSSLVTVLLREFQDKRRREFLRGVSGRQVAISHVWRFRKLGDPRVFRRKTQACGVDTAVSILLDRSGSMDDDIEQAANVTYALSLAMQRIPGVQVSIDVFPGFEANSEEILGFKQNVHVAKMKLEIMSACGGTPTGSALAERLPRLLATKAEKKLMLVVTDGHPNPEERPLAEAMIAQAKTQGVEVIGIGLGIDVGHLFDANVTVDSVEDLASAFEALFKSEIAEKLAA